MEMPHIVVTPAMSRAGVAELGLWIPAPLNIEVAERVFLAMVEAWIGPAYRAGITPPGCGG
jgi:hypothetical protein